MNCQIDIMVEMNQNTKRTLVFYRDIDESSNSKSDGYENFGWDWASCLLCACDGLMLFAPAICAGWRWMAADGSIRWNEDPIDMLMAEDTPAVSVGVKIQTTFWWQKIPLRVVVFLCRSILFLCIFLFGCDTDVFSSWRQVHPDVRIHRDLLSL